MVVGLKRGYLNLAEYLHHISGFKIILENHHNILSILKMKLAFCQNGKGLKPIENPQIMFLVL